MGGGRRHWIPTTVYDREERNQRGRRTDDRNLLDEWVHDKKSRDLNAEYVWNKAQFDKVDPRHTDYLLGEYTCCLREPAGRVSLLCEYTTFWRSTFAS